MLKVMQSSPWEQNSVLHAVLLVKLKVDASIARGSLSRVDCAANASQC